LTRAGCSWGGISRSEQEEKEPAPGGPGSEDIESVEERRWLGD